MDFLNNIQKSVIDNCLKSERENLQDRLVESNDPHDEFNIKCLIAVIDERLTNKDK